MKKYQSRDICTLTKREGENSPFRQWRTVIVIGYLGFWDLDPHHHTIQWGYQYTEQSSHHAISIRILKNQKQVSKKKQENNVSEIRKVTASCLFRVSTGVSKLVIFSFVYFYLGDRSVIILSHGWGHPGGCARAPRLFIAIPHQEKSITVGPTGRRGRERHEAHDKPAGGLSSSPPLDSAGRRLGFQGN